MLVQVNYQGVLYFSFVFGITSLGSQRSLYIYRACLYIEVLKATELLNVNNSCFSLCFFPS